MSLPPRQDLLDRLHNLLWGTLLVRYPEAPARSTRTANWSSGCMLNTSTGISGWAALSSCNASARSCPHGEVQHNQVPGLLPGLGEHLRSRARLANPCAGKRFA